MFLKSFQQKLEILKTNQKWIKTNLKALNEWFKNAINKKK